jgi:hypothetical protein
VKIRLDDLVLVDHKITGMVKKIGKNEKRYKVHFKHGGNNGAEWISKNRIIRIGKVMK